MYLTLRLALDLYEKSKQRLSPIIALLAPK